MWTGTLIGLWLAAAAAPGAQDAWGSVLAEVPRAAFVPVAARPPGPPLRRTHDLFQSFFDGDGVWESAKRGGPETPPPGIIAVPLPWLAEEGRGDAVRLVTWRGRAPGTTEMTYGFVLASGDNWCSPTISLEPGARLRFEAVPLSSSGQARLQVRWRGAAGSRPLRTVEATMPAELGAAGQQDVALPAARGAVCLAADGGRVAVGEARLLAPEPAGADPRPRWIIVTVVDTLRADVLDGTEAAADMPALLRLARSGARYRNAFSGGSHTKAAVWPLLMGRDLMRVDPRMRSGGRMSFTSIEQVYSRPNLFVSHFAQNAGYHSVFLGNNDYLQGVPAFGRASIQGSAVTGTVDGIARLGDLIARYADDRILLVYYLSTPHAHSATPQRLYAELGCGTRSGLDEMRCRYRARVRHADEAIGELQRALSFAGLAGETLQVVTADHGEDFEDGWPVEADGQGAWNRMDAAHGFTTDTVQTHVPLVVSGRGFAPGLLEGRVSTLDIVPTLLQVMGLPSVSRLDGEPLTAASASSHGRDRHFLAYGFCSQSDLFRDRQFVWWDESTCGRRRLAAGKRPLDGVAEVWARDSLVASSASDPARVGPLLVDHAQRVAERLPAAALVLQAAGLESLRVTVTALEGRIVDFGPSATVTGLQGIREAVLAADGRSLRLRLERYRGLYAITTSPPLAPVRLSVEAGGGPPPIPLVGPLQLPLDVLDRALDPRVRPAYFLSAEPPPPRAEAGPALRIWWGPYERAGRGTGGDRLLADLNRVLREWGYIR